MSLKPIMFQFPGAWCRDVRCSAEVFDPKCCAAKYHDSATGSDRACYMSSRIPGVVLYNFSYKYGGIRTQLRCQNHPEDEAVANRKKAYPPTWHAVLAAYEDLAPTSVWNEVVLDDLTRKVNALDARLMFNALHGLLWHGPDDADLCRLLLKMGVDAEAKYAFEADQPHLSSDRPVAGADLVGGTAVHFAAERGRVECLAVLIEAGVTVEEPTRAGKKPIDLAQEEEVREMLTRAASTGAKNLAQLAYEGKFYAIFYRMRVLGKLSRQAEMAANLLNEKFEGKTAPQWLAEVAFNKHVIPEDAAGSEQAPSVAHMAYLELCKRYNVRQDFVFGTPSMHSQSPSTVTGHAADGASDGSENRQGSNSQLTTILEGLNAVLDAVQKLTPK